jgi:5,6-dimethylbenzimidazole synthase
MEHITQRTFTAEDQALLQDILLHRRDVRGNRFINTPIPETEVTKILKAAVVAPSVGFSQPWEFVLIKNPETKQAIKQSFSQKTAEAAQLFADKKQQDYQTLKLEGIVEAPLNIAVFYKPKDGPVLGQTSMPNMGKYSVVCAIQNMWLMARTLNIGMGWVSILDPEKVKHILNAPKDHQLIGYLCLGYTDMFYNQPELELKQWERKKQLEDVIIKETY